MKNRKGFISIVTVIVIAVLAVGFAGVAVYYETQKDKTTNSTTSTTVASNTNTNTNTNSVVNTNTVTDQFIDEIVCTNGWSTYTNDRYGYTIMHPPSAVITLLEQNSFSLSPEEVAAGLTFEEKFANYGAELCVSIKMDDIAYINIAAPENAEAGVICHRSGVGVILEQIDRSDSLTIDGLNYTGTGKVFISEDPTTGIAGTTLMYKNETNSVMLSDNTKIEYGSTPADYVLYDTYEPLRNMLYCILESYTSI